MADHATNFIGYVGGWIILLTGVGILFAYRGYLFTWTMELVRPALEPTMLALGKFFLWISFRFFDMSEKLVNAVKLKHSFTGEAK